ncbi:hypothetical protein L210DRAFT_3611472 [Boletus edulis BED1]|uniref:RING-type domain-containing protein n=1 Tax=Boletus edulis BED1 TaxID=1328754 RepID=A0AAD4BXY6_BOLED|nr:hypothetical protein L210DRAFT_3611472 [Boletus edulis BED1]
MTRLLIACLFLLFHACSAHPSSFLSLYKFSPTSPDGTWLWGWVWGAECSVSVVDRSPPLSFRSRPATFGPELNDPLLGYVLPLSSFTFPCPDSILSNRSNSACPPLCHIGPHRPDPKESWIALVQRGHCPFVDKEHQVREAQRLGARAVVVGGEDPNLTGLPDTLVNMYSKADASDITLPSTYITYSDYRDLMLLIDSSTTRHAGLKTLSLLITTQYSAWEWYSPILTFVVILILPSCLTFVTLLIHRVRMARAAQRDRAPEHLVKSLPWRVWNGSAWEKHQGSIPQPDPSSLPATVDVEAAEQSDPIPSTSHDLTPWCESQLECAICLSEFAKGDRVRELPCHHIFHLDEVDTWLINRKKLCPVCKADVTQPWHLALARKVSNTPSSTDSNRPPTPTTPSPPTERTPLLHDRNVDGALPDA